MKQAILIRTDLGMKKGKMVAQGAHAAVMSARRIHPNDKWYFEGMPKVALAVTSLEELMELVDKARKSDMIAYTITDAGKTTFIEPTVTCGVIGPAEDQKIEEITGHLRLL